MKFFAFSDDIHIVIGRYYSDGETLNALSNDEKKNCDCSAFSQHNECKYQCTAWILSHSKDRYWFGSSKKPSFSSFIPMPWICLYPLECQFFIAIPPHSLTHLHVDTKTYLIWSKNSREKLSWKQLSSSGNDWKKGL